MCEIYEWSWTVLIHKYLNATPTVGLIHYNITLRQGYAERNICNITIDFCILIKHCSIYSIYMVYSS